MSVSERLRLIMSMNGFASPYAMARGTGLSRSSLQNALNKNVIGPQLAAQIAAALNLNTAWIESGFGEMRPIDDRVQGIEIDVGQHPVAESPIDQYAYAYIKKAKARLSAGGGVIPEEEFEDQRYAFIRSWLKTVATSESACVLMEIDGDSMRPTLESGDMVLVDQGRQDLISDGIYAFGEGDVINIKRLQRVYPNVRIVSDNPDRECYPSREVDPSTIRIIGRVIWFARQLR